MRYFFSRLIAKDERLGDKATSCFIVATLQTEAQTLAGALILRATPPQVSGSASLRASRDSFRAGSDRHYVFSNTNACGGIVLCNNGGDSMHSLPAFGNDSHAFLMLGVRKQSRAFTFSNPV